MESHIALEETTDEPWEKMRRLITATHSIHKIILFSSTIDGSFSFYLISCMMVVETRLADATERQPSL